MAVFVVHGESGVAESFSDLVHQKLGWNSRAPKDGDSVVLYRFVAGGLFLGDLAKPTRYARLNPKPIAA